MDENELRDEFERIASNPPFEKVVKRFPDDPSKYAWPGAYKDIHIDFAFEVAKDLATWADARARRECADICLSQASVEGIAQSCADAILDTIPEGK